MINSDVIDRYSIPLAKQMMKIGKLGADIEPILRMVSQTCPDVTFIDDTFRTFKSIGGKPGDAALEVYRDLEDNICTLNAFLQKYQDKKRNSAFSVIIEHAEQLHIELCRLDELVKRTPPDVMKEIKNMIKHGRYMTATDEEKYEFKGSSIVMVASFMSVILLRYFEVIKWSWYIVVPLAIAAMVVITALVSTFRFSKRGY